MGALIVSEFISLDGFYADADGGLDWVVADDEHHDYSIDLLERAGLLLFGRKTWEIFETYWLYTPAAGPVDRINYAS